jgi:hypothetical protein
MVLHINYKKFLLLTFCEHILFPKSKVTDSEILRNLPFGMAYLQLTAGSKPYTSDIYLVNYLQIKSSDLGTEAQSLSRWKLCGLISVLVIMK